MADVSPRDAAGSPAPSSRRALGAGVLLLIVALGVPIAAIALTAAVPTGATAPHPAAGPVERPLPAPPATSVPLPQVEALPIVASEPRRPALDRYRGLRPGDASGAIDMFEAAWASLDAPADARSAIRAYRRAMLFEGQAGPEGEDQAPFTSESFGTTAATAMAALGRDAANAGHLNDAAVALFALAEASGPGGGGPGSSGSLSYNDAGRLQAAAIRLLTDASATFPSHRGLRINLAFLRNLFGDENSDPDVAIDDLRQFVASAPTDLTARLLLASLQTRRWDRDGLEDALATLADVHGDDATEAAVDLARGDALVASIDRAGGERPELDRALAEQALEAYDRALGRTQDAAAFAGRAVALDLLGERAAAVVAQRRAVQAAPDSAVQALRLAILEGCAGDQAGRRTTAEGVLDGLRPPPTPALSGIRFVPGGFDTQDDLGIDRGTFGISLGSERIPAEAFRIPVSGGGGYLVDADLFLTRSPCLGADDTTMEQRALDEATAASVALGDPVGAQRELDAVTVPAGSDEGDDETGTDVPVVDAARVVAGQPVADPDTQIEATLAAVVDLPPQQAARLCRADLAAMPPLATTQAEGTGESDRVDLIDCVLRAAMKTGDTATADWAIDQIGPWMVNWSEGQTILAAGDARRAEGRLDDAERLYRLSAQSEASFAPAMIRLGELALDRRDAAAARAYDELAVTAVESGGSLQDASRSRNLRRLGQLAHNNRGIALLMGAPADAAGAPDCAGHADLCRLVASDFEAALASDPANWTYLWNLGWVERLQGDLPAAEEHLGQAIVLKPDLVPALNDLGVLEARRGATASALARLRLAAELDPAYDLAAWNLGVLESSQGPAGVVDGQAWLREATRRNPDLRTKPVGYLTDERIYRVSADAAKPLTLGSTNAPAAGAVAFATVATVGGLMQLLGSLGEPAQDAAAVVLEAGIATRRRRIERGLRSRMPWLATGRRPHLAWIPVLGILGAATLWNVLGTATDAPWATFLLAAVAVLAGIACHMLGHLAVSVGRVAVRPAAWWPGIVLAVVALPFQVPVGPFPAERVSGTDRERAWRITLAGPVAVIVAAAIAYAGFLVAAVPFLRLLSQVELSVAAYALMPFAPLDGARLADRHPAVLAGLGLLVAAFSAAFVLGLA